MTFPGRSISQQVGSPSVLPKAICRVGDVVECWSLLKGSWVTRVRGSPWQPVLDAEPEQENYVCVPLLYAVATNHNVICSCWYSCEIFVITLKKYMQNFLKYQSICSKFSVPHLFFPDMNSSSQVWKSFYPHTVSLHRHTFFVLNNCMSSQYTDALSPIMEMENPYTVIHSFYIHKTPIGCEV